MKKTTPSFLSIQERFHIFTAKMIHDQTGFFLAQEYCMLSKLVHPSEDDIERLSAILELAQYDHELNCLINEADHLIAYELDLYQELPTTFKIEEREGEQCFKN